MESMQIPQIDAVQEPDNISNYDPSPKHQVTDPGVIFKRYVFASGAICWLIWLAFSTVTMARKTRWLKNQKLIPQGCQLTTRSLTDVR